MLNTDLMSGVSLETLGAMLVSSILLAECALSEAPFARAATNPVGAAIAHPPRSARLVASAESGDSDREFDAQPRGVSALRRAERMRSRGLSRCLSRSRVRRVIRIRGRR